MDGFLQVLDWLMQPIYWAMSGIIVGFHWLYSQVMDPHSRALRRPSWRDCRGPSTAWPTACRRR